MPAKNGFELQDRDIELLHSVYQLRIASVDHLAALSGRSVRALWGRLLKLKERRYLASVARFMQKQVYAIGSEAVPVLIEHGYASRDFANKRPGTTSSPRSVSAIHFLSLTSTRVCCFSRAPVLSGLSIGRKAPRSGIPSSRAGMIRRSRSVRMRISSSSTPGGQKGEMNSIFFWKQIDPP
jgi:hypothetical protein